LSAATNLNRAAGVLITALLVSLLGIAAATQAAVATCGSLAGLALPDTTITAAQSIPAGTYTAPSGQIFTGLPGFCRIAATLTPTADSDINIEIWMPLSTWNGKFLGLGNVSFGGSFLYNVLARYLPLNYAMAQTDMGTSPGRPLVSAC
jgi:feruloyl esterase